jgi:ribosome-associated protein
LLRFAQVKKAQRASKSVAKGKQQSAGRKAGNAGHKTASKGARTKGGGKGKADASSRREPGRIPVRGARSSGPGVKPRSAVQAAATAPRRDVSDVLELAVAAMEAAMDKKALLPVLIDVSAMASYTDFIGIVSGRSDRQVDAIAEHVSHELKLRGQYLLGQEGSGSGRWTLLDFGAFVIHVFYHPVREFYDLESLWIEAPRVKLDVPPEATLSQPDALYGAL